ncbi:TPA: hypothetical protein ACGCNR_001545 [Stenotrophomonas maltophilia]
MVSSFSCGHRSAQLLGGLLCGVAQRQVLCAKADHFIGRDHQLLAQHVLGRLLHAARFAGEKLVTHERISASTSEARRARRGMRV